jgi:hypothetical protein
VTPRARTRRRALDGPAMGAFPRRHIPGAPR